MNTSNVNKTEQDNVAGDFRFIMHDAIFFILIEGI